MHISTSSSIVSTFYNSVCLLVSRNFLTALFPDWALEITFGTEISSFEITDYNSFHKHFSSILDGINFLGAKPNVINCRHQQHFDEHKVKIIEKILELEQWNVVLYDS